MTPPAVDAAFADALAAALDAGDVACVQLRLKDVDDDAIRRACDALRPVAQSRDVAFILNDRPDLAAATGCDGVHVGQQDARYAEARAALGADRIVGVTCHDSRRPRHRSRRGRRRLRRLRRLLPDRDQGGQDQASPELLRQWSDVTTVPCVAIGGITADELRRRWSRRAPISCGGRRRLGPSGRARGAPVKAFNAAISRHSR